MCLPSDQPAMARPSLYATIKLARIVQHVKECLKSHRHKKSIKMDPLVVSTDNVKLQVQQVIDKKTKPLPSHVKGFKAPSGSEVNVTPSTTVPRLLQDLDTFTLVENVTLSSLAFQDCLFLQHDQYHLAVSKDISKLRLVIDVTAALLNHLRRHSVKTDIRDLSVNAVCKACDDFSCEKYKANLEHLIMSLQKDAMDAIVQHYIEMSEDGLLRWYQYWLHKRGAIDDWFAEWPNGQHPLSTTWPWNIKPALLVLWGVCWMFYDNEGRSSQEIRGPGYSGQTFWTRQAAAESPSQQQNNQVAWAGPTTYPNYSWLHPYQAGAVSTRRASNHTPASTLPAFPTSVSTYPYISPSPVETSDLFSSPSSGVLPYTSGRIATPAPVFDHNLWQSTEASLNTVTSLPENHGDNPFSFLPYVVPHARTNQARRGGTPNLLGYNVGAPRRNMQDYPSPQLSDVSGQVDPSYSAFQPNIMASPSVTFPKSPSVSGSPESRRGNMRDREPLQNATGAFLCDHPGCISKPEVFARKCEWSKHMDKHDRPYVCDEPGCENIRGFTYSGGLHRHQKEVHRQHGGPRGSCHCPYKDCKRSTGAGFSRKENLAEHIRRVHRDDDAPSSPQEEPHVASSTPLGRDAFGSQTLHSASGPRKRRRRANDDEFPGAGGDEGGDEGQTSQDLRQEVKKLRRELAEKDERLQRLEEQVQEMLARSR